MCSIFSIFKVFFGVVTIYFDPTYNTMIFLLVSPQRGFSGLILQYFVGDFSQTACYAVYN